MITDFIWSGRKPKLKIQQLIQSKNEDGLKLVSVLDRDKALKINWVYKLYGTDVVLNKLATYHLAPKINNEIFWECNFCTDDINSV